ncbi:hypothetical protein [Xanthobacter oligotrophicus]|uniref:hypothetical protein n=1 Tax=Xanthobacter oligotrophicus TaxID=2607286 RepID=UPI0011F3A9ED|nr:hypothetical protein [Xanthobacter oligotrophicus]MCG5237557.1 hypothetical protein [Xanthobacter oligotrophicus]
MSVASTVAAYACFPRLGGAGVRLQLAPPVLEFAVGPKEGRLALADVTTVTLRFLPAKFANHSFEIELSGRDGTKLKTGSASRISLTGVRDQGADYAAFVRALHAALAKAGSGARFSGGYGPWRFALMVAVGFAALAGLATVLGFAVMERQWSVALFLGAMGAFVVWPTAQMIWRNRPVRYTPDAIPAYLLPA